MSHARCSAGSSATDGQSKDEEIHMSDTNEIRKFAAQLMAGAYRHLTPRPEKPADLSLEHVGALYLDERARAKGDQHMLQVVSGIMVLLMFVLFQLVLLIFDETIDEMTTAEKQVNIVLFVLTVSVALIPSHIAFLSGKFDGRFRSSRRLSAFTKARTYEERINAFRNKLQQLVDALDLVEIADLAGRRREELTERVMVVGTKLASSVRICEAADNRDDYERATELRQQIGKLYDIAAGFGLVEGGGYTEFFRRADALNEDMREVEPAA